MTKTASMKGAIDVHGAVRIKILAFEEHWNPLALRKEMHVKIESIVINNEPETMWLREDDSVNFSIRLDIDEPVVKPTGNKPMRSYIPIRNTE